MQVGQGGQEVAVARKGGAATPLVRRNWIERLSAGGVTASPASTAELREPCHSLDVTSLGLWSSDARPATFFLNPTAQIQFNNF